MRFVYVTTRDRAEARAIGRALVEARLAACVNIIEGMESIYRWQGAVEEARETILIAKTSERNVAALIEAVKAAHSYDVPCVVTLPILEGNPPYLQWLTENVR